MFVPMIPQEVSQRIGLNHEVFMSKGKQRWYPDKPQNNMPLVCPRYEDHGGSVYCEQGNVGDARVCHGNPHNCVKTKYHRAASRSNNKNKSRYGREKAWKKFVVTANYGSTVDLLKTSMAWVLEFVLETDLRDFAPIHVPCVSRKVKPMRAILFNKWFEAPDELNEFCKSIGYTNPNYANDFDLMFDERIVSFCEQRLSQLWDELVYKGKDSYKFKIGFAGAGYIRDIDTSRKWKISHNQVDAPIIDYVEPCVNKYGHLTIKYLW